MAEKPKSLIQQLDEQVAAGAVASTPTASEVITKADNPDLLAQLVRLLLLKEGRDAAAAQVAIDAEAARAKRRELNSKEEGAGVLLKQARCKHLKGGGRGPKNAAKDYALSLHTYVNAETVAKCLICGAKWHPEDTKEWLMRGGKKISNHTHIGWREVGEMLESSSNTPTSSEIPANVIIKGTAGLSERGDKAGLPLELTIKDSEGNVAHDIEL
jgi:hypothetical protein